MAYNNETDNLIELAEFFDDTLVEQQAMLRAAKGANILESFGGSLSALIDDIDRTLETRGVVRYR